MTISTLVGSTGADGVTTHGTGTFTAASGNFKAADVGKLLTIEGNGHWLIDAVVDANTLTLDTLGRS